MKTVSSGFPLVNDTSSNIKKIDVSIQGVVLDYTAANIIAGVLAEKAAGGKAMLVAWFDGKKNVGYPEVQECTGGKPGWLAYAESHGGNFGVNINSGEFIFVFATGLEN